MLIRCWGSRGSLPVSGPQFNKYGGDTTCVEVRSSKGDIVILDAGSGIRALGNRLVGEEVKRITILFTHAHWDHLLGFPFFAPLYRKGVSVTVVGCPYTFESYTHVLDGLMSPPYCPVRIEMLRASLRFKTVDTRPFSVGSLRIRPVYLNHPNGGVGYRIEEKGTSFVMLTDNNLGFHHDGGLEYAEYVDFCRGADLLFHDAEYTPEEYQSFRHFGHSDYLEVVRLAIEAGVENLGLFHINKDRTDREVDAMVATARTRIKNSAARVKCFAVATGQEISL